MVDSIDDILKELSDEQKKACKEKNNILLTACPGSGKTHTLTHRLAYQVLQKPYSKKIKIAITYTNRAAEEITNRLNEMNIDLSSIWTGTIHQFCMHFIIRPYAMYSKRLCKGYRVINDYSKKRYLQEITKQLNLSFKSVKESLNNKNVRDEYNNLLKKNKEIDFDSILIISQEMLSSYPFINSNISSIVSSILVDEFQDTNELQYEILSNIYKANKSINLTFVGDVNQSIYGSLGGVAKNIQELQKIYETEFISLSINSCYRSTQRLVNLYSKFEVSKTNAYSVAPYKNYLGEIYFDDSINYNELINKISCIINKELKKGIKAEEICIIAPQRYLLFNLSKELRSKLPDIPFNALDISIIKYDPMNPLFLIAKLLFMPSGKNVTLRKRIASEFISIIMDDFKITVPDNIKSYDILYVVNCCRSTTENGIICLKKAIKKVFEMINIYENKEQLLSELEDSFFKEIDDRVKHYSLNTDFDSICKYFESKKGVVLSTLHGVKGEEYTTVIATSLLNGYLPHWEYIYNNEKKVCRKTETYKLLYVLCSRAKKNLYLFSEKGRKTRKGYNYTPTDELSLIKNDIIKSSIKL